MAPPMKKAGWQPPKGYPTLAFSTHAGLPNDFPLLLRKVAERDPFGPLRENSLLLLFGKSTGRHWALPFGNPQGSALRASGVRTPPRHSSRLWSLFVGAGQVYPVEG